MAAAPARYAPIAIALHWMIAVLILANIPLGFWMSTLREAGGAGNAQAIFQSFQIHKTIGFLVLGLSIARLAWRIANPPPPLPPGMKTWERAAAHATHWAFYGLMLALPLSGWVYVSTGYTGDGAPLAVPTYLFFQEALEVPHLGAVAGQAAEARKALAAGAYEAHELFAFAAIGLVALHVGAALKHQFFDKDGLFARMTPGPRAPAPPPRWALGAGAFVAFLALAVALPSLGAPAPVAAAPPAVLDLEALETGSPPAPSPDPPTTGAAPTPAPTPASAPPPAPDRWRVDMGASRIGFSATHLGNPFRGQFARWRADIRFSPDALEQSAVTVRIDAGSVSVDNSYVDGGLRDADGFDVANHPVATFRADRFRRLGPNRYEARGTLTVKGRSVPVTLPFQLTITGDQARMTASLRLDRIGLGLGLESDAAADYVSAGVEVEIAVLAQRLP